MTLYDAAMVGVVVLGMVWGALRGITWQVASIASLVLGYLVAFPLSGQLAPQFPGEPIVARALALLVCYVAVSGGVFLVAWVVRATLRQWRFEAFDRHLGMILGGLEGALLGVVATLFVVSLSPSARGPIFTSPTGRVVGRVLDVVEPVLPGEVRTVLSPFWSDPDAAAGRLSAGADPADASDRRGPDAPEARPGSLKDLVQEGEARVGRALKEAAEEGLDLSGRSHGRDVERR
jgi:membrane protein required for colicin V production